MKPTLGPKPMIGEQLHDYDVDICDYVSGNIRPHLDDPDFAAEINGSLPPRLEHHLLAGRCKSEPPDLLLLDDVELNALEAALMVSLPELDRSWVPSEPLHQRHVCCVREIRDELTRQDAEDWSRASARFARRLNARRLHVFEGIAVVHDWVRHIRRLKRAMGATHFLPYPDGLFPTPTAPTPLKLDAGDGANDRAKNEFLSPVGALRDDQPRVEPQDDTLRDVLATVNQVLELVSSQRLIRDYYSTEQAATYLGKAHWTVREWCRLGRVVADKRFSGRGRSPEWVLSHAELQRIQKEGLLPLPKH